MKKFRVFVPVIAIVFGALASAAGVAGLRSEDRESGFGRPETITGTIIMVLPDHNLVILAAQTGADRKTSIAEPDLNAPEGSKRVLITQSGETDFAFRLTTSSEIGENGRQLALADLGSLVNKEATVHFVPRRTGNFVESIEVRD